ncbi:DUF3570 domain-containing protein [Marinicellulosiphila megalodicopiae]|uniref:DUF3570 domain-containing protein n=1 Tax=Marinicellulosiphila megalodicopiae TaxID=2724896 RepID=UPI003BAFE5A8
MKKNHKLLALTASAMTLPGIAIQAQATSAPAESEVGYRFSGYFESDIDEARVITGSNERYDILVNQFHLLHPINDHAVVTYEGTFETLSGASQYLSTYRNADGSEPVNDSTDVFDPLTDKVGVHMSGASIQEKRIDSFVGARFYKSKTEESDAAGNYGAKAGFSSENDYLSLSIAGDGSMEFDDAHTTLSAGASFALDTLDPTPASGTVDAEDDSNSPGRQWSSIYNKRTSSSVFAGVGQIINPTLVVQANASFTLKNGTTFLTDHYREFNGASVDRRPKSRAMVTFSTGMRKAIPDLDTAIHADYRFYWDDWGVLSNTLSLAWYQRFVIDSDDESGIMSFMSDNDVAFVISPNVRYYHQTAASFYEILSETAVANLSEEQQTAGDSNSYNFLTSDSSSDPRLAAYGALSAGMGFRAEFLDIAFVSNFELYTSSPGLGISNRNQELPNAMKYFRFTAGLDYKF